MPVMNPVLVDVVRLIARETVLAAATAASSGTPLASTTSSTLATTSSVSSKTTAIASASNSAANVQPTGSGGNQSQSQGSSSPLLFFVALGFGVVFTNLWIIVGVKYCFRYNARNRRLRLGEDGEPINLEAMPRPRRRREKKLMTMDEVNEKFPMQKYKNWVAGRAQEGLPTRGGVTAPPSRANSVQDVEGTVPETPSKERESMKGRESMEDRERPTTSATSKTNPDAKLGHEAKDSTSDSVVVMAAPVSSTTTDLQDPATAKETQMESLVETFGKTRTSQDDDDEDDDDEHIDAALPPECMGTSGDTCAICIDSLEDDDDVRGLTCGHAFHAGCLDPWLTSRRACCPLCKADYYTPKPRPNGAEAGDGTRGPVVVNLVNGSSNRMNLPSRPGTTWLAVRGRGVVLPSRFTVSNQGQQIAVDHGTAPRAERTGSRFGFFGRSRLYADTVAVEQPTAPQPADTAGAADTSSRGRFPALREAFPSRFAPFRSGRGSSTEGPGANSNVVSPSNLEAGVRPAEAQ